MNGAGLLILGRYLAAASYRFVTPTPATVARINRRPGNERAGDLAGAFGWSRPFRSSLLDPELLALLRGDRVIVAEGDLWRSTVRASTVGDALYFHSAFPTDSGNSVFFGPDSYRFVQLIERSLPRAPPSRVLDLGCGSGIGGLHAASLLERSATTLILSDINPAALALARVNAALAGHDASVVESDLFTGISGFFDLILANPPYMMDDAHRAYRDGGEALGAALSLRILSESLGRLRPGGSLVLYTGSAIIGGVDRFAVAAAGLLAGRPVRYRYSEIDPDVFGEELDRPTYSAIDRIAVVGLVVINDQ